MSHTPKLKKLHRKSQETRVATWNLNGRLREGYRQEEIIVVQDKKATEEDRSAQRSERFQESEQLKRWRMRIRREARRIEVKQERKGREQ